MSKFFKLTFPDGKSIAIVSKRKYVGLLGLVDIVEDKDNTYISNISLFEFIRYVLRGK